MAKKISQEELRKAMMEARKKQTIVKKIDSPLAKYNDLGQLTCVICKIVIKSDAVWPIHLNSKVHKENILIVKETKLRLESAAQGIKTHKRTSTFQEPQPTKKVKGILKNSGKPSTNAKANLPVDFFENSPGTSNINSISKSTSALNATNGAAPKTNLTNGFHKQAETEDEAAEAQNSKNTNQSTLPEGFFDDPIMDAKARNVEYKDPIEEEWEKFQKEIKEETHQSEQIIGVEQEEAATERQIDEVEEQMRNWSRVMDMVERKKQVQTADKKKDNDDTSSDEDDFEEFLDWRAKKS